jgi:hypothetical protein
VNLFTNKLKDKQNAAKLFLARCWGTFLLEAQLKPYADGGFKQFGLAGRWSTLLMDRDFAYKI